MMETIQKGLELTWQYGEPILPYAAIALVIYVIMNQFVKPLIASHKNSKGKHNKPLWLNLRRGYPLYPMVMGFVVSLLLPQLSWGYCVTAGAASQGWYLIFKAVRAWLKKKGIELPTEDADVKKSMMMDTGTNETVKKK